MDENIKKGEINIDFIPVHKLLGDSLAKP